MSSGESSDQLARFAKEGWPGPINTLIARPAMKHCRWAGVTL